MLEQLIKESVKETLEKIGKSDYYLMLSGGIDSGLLAAFMRPRRMLTIVVPQKHELFEAGKITEHLKLPHGHTSLRTGGEDFDEVMRIAVKTIGRPIPHFNIYPLYKAFKYIKGMGVKHVVVGDGPDESMCGYTRHLIMNYLYKSFDVPAFDNYHPMISSILEPPAARYAKLINKLEVKLIVGRPLIDTFCHADMQQMRPDMNEMGDRLAKHFGITIHRPYEEKDLDNYMFNLSPEKKIDKTGEFGKYALRKIAAKYLPREIAWNKHKMGGPVFPVNKLKGWDKYDGEFGKMGYIAYQDVILSS